MNKEENNSLVKVIQYYLCFIAGRFWFCSRKKGTLTDLLDVLGSNATQYHWQYGLQVLCLVASDKVKFIWLIKLRLYDSSPAFTEAQRTYYCIKSDFFLFLRLLLDSYPKPKDFSSGEIFYWLIQQQAGGPSALFLW